MDAPATRRRFDALVLPHLDAAYNLARWLCGNTGDAEDVVQEAFLRAFRLFGSFRGDQPRPWLLAIVRNTWFTTCEKRRGAAETDYEEGEMDTALPDWHGAATDPEQWLMREEDVRLVHAALARLPVVFREVIVLRELEELHYRDIARIAQIPVGTVMSRLARGRRMLAATVTALRDEAPMAPAPADRQDLSDAPPAHPAGETKHGLP
ncbi:RNA polymerase sigma factor [Cupriavidus sp. 2KB_3]|uniref:RNA polymerase sigma factor n=1 Tax=Cupriavidus TaxID=106589 RepID=UPI0011ED8475|nr:RNA polymerase sigma factor [Cupriavidus campinensis]